MDKNNQSYYVYNCIRSYIVIRNVPYIEMVIVLNLTTIY